MNKNVIFDLDGTLIDSAEGIIKSIIYALDKMGIKDYDKEDLKKFIGPPLIESFTKFVNLSEQDGRKGVRLYRERYSVIGYKENSLYSGVRQMLYNLKKGGANLYIASSKPEEFVRKIMIEHGLDNLFSYMAGATIDGSRDTKEQVLDYLIKGQNLDKSDCIMVGDRKHDIVGAHFFGIKCIAVLYGFGNLQEFNEYGADFIVNTPKEIEKIVFDN